LDRRRVVIRSCPNVEGEGVRRKITTGKASFVKWGDMSPAITTRFKTAENTSIPWGAIRSKKREL